MVAAGYGTHDIAASLVLSVETIRYHLKCAYRNLGVHTRSEATAWLETAKTCCIACGRPFEDTA